MLADEAELSHRAYGLAMALRKQFGDTVPLDYALRQQQADQQLLSSPASAAQQQYLREQYLQGALLTAQNQLIAAGQIGMPAPPPSPLDVAIADPEVSIYEVIRLAEETVDA